jgi:FKBP-type peptidyl-prolyl cis-trans isomerase
MKNSCVKISLATILFIGLLFSCKTPVQEMETGSSDSLEQEFLKVNKYLADKNRDQIEAFVNRVGWEMEISSTGLWYHIEKSDRSDQSKTIQENSRVSYAFVLQLLDGTHCYEATAERPKIINVGKGGVEAGFEEGILKMSEGDSAIFIIPPHLGHGNFGDRNKIPGNSVIIYKVRVLNVS